MIQARLRRIKSGDSGTFGVLEIGAAQFCTGELPWRDNASRLSCIPSGTYQARWASSLKFGSVYQLQAVPGRTNILFHAGNWCGDAVRGLESDTEGCILVGMGHGQLEGQDAVTNSHKGLDEFHDLTGKEDLQVIITDEWQETGQPTTAGQGVTV